METPMANEGRLREFERVVLSHLDAAYNLARWIVRDPAAAEDAARDAALRAWRQFESFRGVSGRAWLLQIARKAAYARIDAPRPAAEDRARDAAARAGNGEVETEPADPRPDPQALMQHRQDATALDQAIDALPVELRECVILREMELLPYQQIAQITGVPIDTVMARLARARLALRNHLAVQSADATTRRPSGRQRDETAS
jgi:RNA polymerase sigma-70 factor, ECF subfamily